MNDNLLRETLTKVFTNGSKQGNRFRMSRLDETVAAIQSLLAPVSAWQQMDSAPKDESILIKEADGDIWRACWVQFHFDGEWMEQDIILKPVAWQPLPAI